MLVKFDSEQIVWSKVQNFELFDKKWFTILTKH